MGGFKLLKSAKRTYCQEGFRSLLSASHRFGRQRLAQNGLVQGIPYHERKRTDSEARWRLIETELDSADTTALDIGCASGFFSARLAESGRFTIGIDVKQHRLENARQVWNDQERVAFARYRLTPDTITMLPDFDVALVLTVYHHWINAFGREHAESMLREVVDKTDKLFFEPPGVAYHKFHTVRERSIRADESVVEYYTDLLDSIFDGQVDIAHLGDAEYPSHDERTDPIFLLDSSGYDR